MVRIELEPLDNGEGYVARIDGERGGKGIIAQATWVALVDSMADYLKVGSAPMHGRERDDV